MPNQPKRNTDIFLNRADIFGTLNRLTITVAPYIPDFLVKPFWVTVPAVKTVKLNKPAPPIVASPFDITLAQLKIICPTAKVSDLTVVLPHLNTTMRKYDINTRLRQAHFLAQVAHESANFRTTKEYASGAAYEGRKDLGNTEEGDGRKFKGRGLIQITGRSNYISYGKYINQDLTTGENPKKLERYPLAADSAGWFWTKVKKLNAKADLDNLTLITKRINGGTNGIKDRRQHLVNAKKAFNIK